MNTLDLLQQRVADDLRLLGQPPENWVPDPMGTDHDVVVVGGGQSGVAAAFALARAGVTRTSVIESRPAAATGSWRAKARMLNLRTAKSNAGPDLDIPSLTFRAWYEAQHGRAAYDELPRIPTAEWASYLEWLREQAGIAVRFGVELLRIEPDAGVLRLHLRRGEARFTETTRKVVLATGIVGSGEPFIPQPVTEALPPTHYAHTDTPIDFAALAGRTVAVLGAGSAAFDAAATALEAGAAEVHLYCRHPRLAAASNMGTLKYMAAQENFANLADPLRWKLAWHFRERSPGPTPEVVARATRFDNFTLHLGAAGLSVGLDGGQVRLLSRGHELRADYLIAGTGYTCDLARRPELAAVAADIALWRDRYAIPEAERQRPNATYPYLGPGYQFQQREPGKAPWVENIYCFNFAAITSFGRHVGDVGSIRYGIPRLVSHLVKDLFLADLDHHVARLFAEVPDELQYAQYAHAVHTPASPATLQGDLS
ncbi:FAD-dependent oxidoreductase [Pseudomonas typographi]|uniref:FAD-dependent oxidoreductase n=1 Tax=Pseudomonas typographi TaxID=2715964 RepID=A0ABR7Z1W5_9PSED|nr:FAD-dependent oxidoreductase [Pseudomonas typographi]MBD1551485.1 FAD-dependent oxidoreductase [Pseudomonas typographi]MBD1587529.1 FAD-dependent oxidoreductase [Pseudomonas typographi]MBD1599388.1 FAD-dependent oxidoreductase [Pseudomonas typographi]